MGESGDDDAGAAFAAASDGAVFDASADGAASALGGSANRVVPNICPSRVVEHSVTAKEKRQKRERERERRKRTKEVEDDRRRESDDVGVEVGEQA